MKNMLMRYRRSALFLFSTGLFLLLQLGISFAQSVSFSPATSIFVGNFPVSVAVGDFNGDGNLDLAVGVSTLMPPLRHVTILLGAGTGFFSSSNSFPVGVSPELIALAAGDFNGDGKLDLVVTNGNSSNVSVLLGTGTGSFGAATNFAVGVIPRSVAVADFNGDGKLDLAVTNSGSNVSILLGTGAGSFGAAANFAVGNAAGSLAIGDFNEDGKLDIVTANSALTRDLSLLLNTTSISFTNLVSALLPSSRSVQVGTSAAAFATIINAGKVTAAGCGISISTSIPAGFIFQTSDPATNAITGLPNALVDIPAGSSQSFVFGLTPTAPIAPTDVQLSFDCANSFSASILSGINTFLLSSSDTPVPDIMALAAASRGIVDIPGTNGTGAFAVATVNMGATGNITVSADTGAVALPLSISLCETNPATVACISVIGPTVTTTINANATPTFGIFVQGNGNVPFDPAADRVFIRFRDTGGGITRGSTSVAVRMQ